MVNRQGLEMIVTRKKKHIPKELGEHMQCWLGGNEDSVTIEFAGVYMLSTSNSREIGYKFVKGKRIPFIKKTQTQLANQNTLTTLYVKATIANGILPPHIDGKVIVLAEFPRRKDVGDNFDSHNMSKFLGDWLEYIGLIDNDKDAEIHCVKRSDYDNGHTTKITLCRRAIAEEASKQFIESMHRVGRRGLEP